MRKFLALLALPAVLLMTSCKDKEVTVNGEKVVLEEGLYGFFKTTQGDIVVKFEDKKAPMTTANFIALAEGRHEDVSEEYKGKPFYDGLKFHRVIPNFMIQGGDPQGTGMGGPGYKFEDEFDDSPRSIVYGKLRPWNKWFSVFYHTCRNTMVRQQALNIRTCCIWNGHC